MVNNFKSQIDIVEENLPYSEDKTKMYFFIKVNTIPT